MIKFTATIEYLIGQRAAIITLTDDHGEWAGAERIEGRRATRSDLYELGYDRALASATHKGGRLDLYRVA